MLDPTGLGVDLGELVVHAAEHDTAGIHDRNGRTRGALIDGQDGLHRRSSLPRVSQAASKPEIALISR